MDGFTMTPASSTSDNPLPYTISLIPQTEEGLQIYLNNYVPFRLRMLQLSPEGFVCFVSLFIFFLPKTNKPLAFSSTYSRESSFPVSTWQARLFNPQARTFIAAHHQEEPNQIISSLTLVLDERTDEQTNKWQVNGMFTLPEARGQGASRGVLEFAEKWAVDEQGKTGRECVLLSLAVMEGNKSAGRFYERVGFKNLGKGEVIAGLKVDWYEKKVWRRE